MKTQASLPPMDLGTLENYQGKNQILKTDETRAPVPGAYAFVEVQALEGCKLEADPIPLEITEEPLTTARQVASRDDRLPTPSPSPTPEASPTPQISPTETPSLPGTPSPFDTPPVEAPASLRNFSKSGTFKRREFSLIPIRGRAGSRAFP